jgi:hypothetical protein
MHLIISARDPAVVDIDYILFEGNKAVYLTRELSVSISGSIAIPIVKDHTFRQVLQKGNIYQGRVKIIELNHNQTRAFMNSFKAVDDAIITETYLKREKMILMRNRR